MEGLLRLLHKLPLQHLRVVRFLFSGGSGVVVNFILLWTLTEFLHLWYLFSLVIAILVGSLLNFTLQKFWTFGNHSLKQVHIQLPKFATLVLFNMILNSA